MTAGRAQDHLALPSDGLGQGLVRGRVAGMKRQNHIGRSRGLKIDNLGGLKGEIGPAKMAASFGIPGKEIFLDVDALHRHGLFKDVVKVVISGKREVGVSTSAVHGGEHLLPRSIGAADLLHCLVYNLQKVVNLPELSLHVGFHSSIIGSDTKLTQEWGRIVSRKQQIFLAIM